MSRKSLTAVLFAGVMATAAQATEVKVQKGAEAAAKAAPDDIICTYETTVGSHMKRRVCASRQDREQRAAAEQDRMNQMRRNSSGKALTQ
jgi:hypothetical protein